MPVIYKIHAKLASDGTEMQEADISMTSDKVKYNNQYNINDKFTNIDNQLNNHEQTPFLSDDGVHGLRYKDNMLQIKDENNEQKVVYDKDYRNTLIGDVIGANITTEGLKALLTQSDPNDITAEGQVIVEQAGTKVVKKIGSVPANHEDGDVLVNYTTPRNKYSSTPLEDNNLQRNVTYYYRFFPYKILNNNPIYTEGTALSIIITVEDIETIPSPAQDSYTYTGSSITPVQNNYNSEQLEIDGNTSGTNAGTYTTTFTPKEGYRQSDGTSSAKSVNQNIDKAIVNIPTVTNTSLSYSGSSQGPTVTSSQSGLFTKSGDITKTNVGNYTLILSLNDNSNYKQSDGTTANRSVNQSIGKASITIPTVSGSYTYNGSTRSANISNYNSTYMTQSGTSSAINAGTYVVSFNLKSTTNYQQSDGTISTKSGSQIINKANGNCTIYPTSITFTNHATNKLFTVSNETGSITIASSDEQKVTVSSYALGYKATAQNIQSQADYPYTATINVKVAESTNYKSVTKIINVTFDVIGLRPWSTADDDQIAKMIDGYYAGELNLTDIQSVQAIGDSRECTTNSARLGFQPQSHKAPRVYINGNQQSNYTMPVQGGVGKAGIVQMIIDFDHDTLTTAQGDITKALITIQTKGLLSTVGPNDTGTTYGGFMSFNSTATNTGGQGSSEIRSYLNGNFYNALQCNYNSSSKLHNKIKQVKKEYRATYSSSTISYSNDYIFLLSAIEIDDTRGTAEGSAYSYYYNTAINRSKKMGQEGATGSSEAQQMRSIDSGSNRNTRVQYCMSSAVTLKDANLQAGISPALCL